MARRTVPVIASAPYCVVPVMTPEALVRPSRTRLLPTSVRMRTRAFCTAAPVDASFTVIVTGTLSRGYVAALLVVVELVKKYKEEIAVALAVLVRIFTFNGNPAEASATVDDGRWLNLMTPETVPMLATSTVTVLLLTLVTLAL